MDTSPRDRITVDLQGLKAALIARAESDGLMPSQVVRQALVAALGPRRVMATQPKQPIARLKSQRLCLRMRPEEVRAVLTSAALAGQRPGRWLGRVAAGGPGVATAEQLDAQHTALVAVSAELAALRRALQRLTLQSRTEAQAVDAMAIAQILGDLQALLASVASSTAKRLPVGRAAGQRTSHSRLARSAM
ncbi:hypothetical protein [Aquincola sp. J276]|uniref:hypothetical protein n=1 Tax=Aquincola sp. J276 TaxID=2898432 RepID=UPI002150E6FF|nr:hypothetical protein [Aquincola sp. J276]MCR5868194.1 hypothetical protein [Aquincola sp. J276]